ncbi:tail fiber domain-containing protein [Aeromonas piscicola]|uniref:Tail fiber domain-containing protein n=1 Tax=Aeromonas piscicola TaxID=600645 RepID=A0ABT7Q7Y4_9GAMM|nr:tail fiber domain-containing protein [Aeromonas piscicola]MDM5130025.1 tail fiber domain-containing protein [Aeromonas piscicola]
MIQIHGVITDPAGKPVPGAIIELRALSTTDEVLMGSVLTFKCDLAGGYQFQLAAGAYDTYAQNDLCGDMDYMGTGLVTAQSVDGTLNSILVDSGISLTPPLLDKALDAMHRAESAADATERDRLKTGSDVIAAELANQLASGQAAAASVSAVVAGSKASDAATSATAAAGSDTRAQKWAENPVDVAVVTGKHSALHHATKAGSSAATAVASASTSVASAATAVAQATNASTSAATAAIKASEATTSASTATSQANVASLAKAAASTSATHAQTHASNADLAAQASERAKVITIEHAGRVATLAQQVSADGALVQAQTGQVAAYAATVAGQAKEVSTNTTSVVLAKTAVQGMRDVVVVKTAQALAAADTASDKASQAAQDQALANSSAQRASQAELIAESWAQNPEGSDINGRPGEFSALHWALQAQKWAQAITSQLVWIGPWNAAAGAPITPAENQGVPFYRISHPGVISKVTYVAGDYLHWDPATQTWFKIDGSDAVISVNSMTGAVVLSAADVGARPASWVPGWADITSKPVTMPPSEHGHPWSQLSNIPVYATRWPTLPEVGAAAASHTHPWTQLTGIPAYAARWPSYAEVTGKPDFAAVSHRHTWEQLDQVPVTASRWPSYAEVTGIPSRWIGAGSGNDYSAGGFEATGNGVANTVFPTYGFHQPGVFAGSIQMRDATSFSLYKQGAAEYANVIAQNGNFNDVYIRSDRRLKSNIEPIQNALAKVKVLSGNLYDKAGQREAGLIAQELAEVQPESVFLNADTTLSIAHAGVLALLVEAVKALDEKVEALQ